MTVIFIIVCVFFFLCQSTCFLFRPDFSFFRPDSPSFQFPDLVDYNEKLPSIGIVRIMIKATLEFRDLYPE